MCKTRDTSKIAYVIDGENKPKVMLIEISLKITSKNLQSTLQMISTPAEFIV